MARALAERRPIAPRLLFVVLAALAATAAALAPCSSGAALPATGGGGTAAGRAARQECGAAATCALEGRSPACPALLPCFGAASEVRFDTGTHGYCYGATSTPDGQIELGLFAGAPQAQWIFRLFSAAGADQGGWVGLLFARGPDIDPWFHWTASGHHGIVHDPYTAPQPLSFRTWNAAGDVVRDTPDLNPIASAPDGQGSSVVVAGTPWGTVLARVNADGWVNAVTWLDDQPDLVLVHWGSGHVLVLKTGPAPRARWYDLSSGPLTDWFDAGYALDRERAAFHGLLDGSIAVTDGDFWRGVFWDGVDHADPPPAWLSARPGTRIANVGGGRGYAVLPKPWSGVAGGFQIQSLVEILDAAGEPCGALELPPLPAPPEGASRRALRLDVGQDGTLFEMSGLYGPQELLGMGGHCVFRWWPGLLR